MKNYQYVLFDWDGCLAKTLDICLDAYKVLFTKYDVHLQDKEIAKDIFGDWNAPSRYGINNEEFAKQFSDILDKTYPHAQLYNGVHETLLELKKQNKKLALVTTSKMYTIKPAMDNNKVTSFFDAILTAEDVTKHKPDPEIIEKALTKLGGTTTNAIIIGDSKSDLGAAQNAGIDSLLFYPKHNEKFYDLETLKTYNPTYIVTDFKQILEAIA